MLQSQRLQVLAESVADGATPDWESAAGIATHETQRETIAQLRAVASIGRFFATLSSGPIDPKRSPTLAPGTTWGALHVIDPVGSGRFGDVYRAWDPALQREVALKILRATGEDPVETDVVEEGRLMARVRHPNVVAIHGAQRIDGATGLWMEFIKGRTLAAELAERGPFSAEEITRVGVELCRALAAVHAAGLVHRDVKAQNVLREESGRIVLGDFGTGRELEDMASSSGALVGTPTYLAPELFGGGRATPQSDLYSLGALLFHLASCTYPVPGRSLRDLRDAHAHGRRTFLTSVRHDFPKRLTRAIERALDPAPTRRFESADSMAQALEGCAAPLSSTPRSRVRLIGVATTLFVAVAVSAVTWAGRPIKPKSIPFAERNWVLLTAFENRAGEPSLDGALEYALERELADSSYVNVVPRPRIEDTLRLMRKPLDTHVDAVVGRELALRDGAIRAIIVGRVERIDRGYSMSARILNPADGSTASVVNIASVARGDLVAAVGRVAIGIRQKLGETLPRLKSDEVRFERVTTPSMRALQLYSQARALTGEVALFNTPSSPRAVEQLLRDALREDPDFVWAHILLTHALAAQGGRDAEAVHHAERAVAAAEPGRLDRYIAEGELNAFRAQFSGNPVERTQYFEQAAASFEAALQLQPDHFWSLTCLLNISERLGRFDAKLVERFVALRPNNVGVLARAVEAELGGSGNLTRARAYAQRGSALDVSTDTSNGFLGNAAANLRIFAARDALWQRNAHQALREADRVAADPRSRAPNVAMNIGLKLADMYVALGRLDRVEQVASWIQPESSGRRLLVVACMEREDRDALRPLLTRLYPNINEVFGGAGGLRVALFSAFVDAGMLDSAYRLLAILKRDADRAMPILLEGQLALAEGRMAEGVQLLDHLVKKDAGGRLFLAGRAALRLADLWMARGEPARAVAILEGVSQHRSRFQDFSPDYMRVRDRLAQLYRQVGRTKEAEQIESDLLLLLAAAPDDHPMKRRLTRASAGST